MEINCRDVMAFIELNKKKAELEFAQNVLGVDISNDLKALSARLDNLSLLMNKAHLEVFFPSQVELDNLNRLINQESIAQIKHSFINRAGPTYDLIVKRGMLVKKNFLNRADIAKLAIALSKLETHERASLAEAIYFSKVENKIDISSVNETLRNQIVKFLNRCQIFCCLDSTHIISSASESFETSLDLLEGRVWIASELKPALEKILADTRSLLPKVQLKNAELQIKEFTDSEQTEFESLQKQYLNLLNQKDELLKTFHEEEKISVVVL